MSRELGHVAKFMINDGNKLGIDIDEVNDPSSLRVLISYFNAKHIFPNSDIEIYESSSGEGYHIVVKGVKSTLKIRGMLGDCQQRMEYSEYRSMLKGQVTGDEIVDDVMFDFKCVITTKGLKVRSRKIVDEWRFIRRW